MYTDKELSAMNGLNPPIRGSIARAKDGCFEDFVYQSPYKGFNSAIMVIGIALAGLYQSPYKGFNRTR